MGKEILTFGNFETENNNFTAINLIYFKDLDSEKVLDLTRFLFVKNYNTLLVTCIIVMLSPYIKCFLKQVLM